MRTALKVYVFDLKKKEVTDGRMNRGNDKYYTPHDILRTFGDDYDIYTA